MLGPWQIEEDVESITQSDNKYSDTKNQKNLENLNNNNNVNNMNQ